VLAIVFVFIVLIDAFATVLSVLSLAGPEAAPSTANV